MKIKEMQLETLLPLIKEQLSSGKSVRFMPRGVSMLPMLRQGIDSVTLSPVKGLLEKYDLPLYRRDNGKFVLHRVVRAENGVYTAIGDNQFIYEHDLRHDQIIAVVTSFSRGDKDIPVSSLPYQIYCRFWCLSRPVRHFMRRAVGKLKRIARRIFKG